MRSEEYLALTGIDQKIEFDGFRDEKAWAIGSETVLLAAMHSNLPILEGVANGQKVIDRITGLRESVGFRIGQPAARNVQAGRQVQDWVQDQGFINTEFEYDCKPIDNEKYNVTSSQLLAMADFFHRQISGSRSESVQSFNTRYLKNTLLPLMDPLAAEIERTRTQDDVFEFAMGGQVFSVISKDQKDYPAVKLLSTQLEYDALIALYHVVIEKGLNYIPILAGPTAESRGYGHAEGSNTNADILLVASNAKDVIPIQVKLHAGDITRHQYHPSTVILDAVTLGAWRTDIRTEKDPETGMSHTVSNNVYVAGRILRRALDVSRRKNVPKRGRKLDVIMNHPGLVDNIYEALCQNPYHDLEVKV